MLITDMLRIRGKMFIVTISEPYFRLQMLNYIDLKHRSKILYKIQYGKY